MHVASAKGDVDLIEKLHQKGVDVNLKDENGYTPMHSAASNNHVDSLRALSKIGGNIHAKDNWGNTPLHWAAMFGHARAVFCLFGMGSKDNIKNKYGRTPLVEAKLHDKSSLVAKWNIIKIKGEKAHREALRAPISIPSSSMEAQIRRAPLAQHKFVQAKSAPSITNVKDSKMGKEYVLPGAKKKDNRKKIETLDATDRRKVEKPTLLPKNIVLDREKVISSMDKAWHIGGGSFLPPSIPISYLTEWTDGFKEEIGEGGFGKVYKGLYYDGKQPRSIAVKKMGEDLKDPDKLKEMKKSFCTEIRLLSNVRHYNLVRLVGYNSFEAELDKSCFYLVYEHVERGDLAELLKKDWSAKSLDWRTRILIAYDIACGLLHLHNRKDDEGNPILHRDIKSANIGISWNNKAKLLDLGLAKMKKRGTDLSLSQFSSSSTTSMNIIGTSPYLDFDYLREHGVYDILCDIYSFGIVLAELFFGIIQGTIINNKLTLLQKPLRMINERKPDERAGDWGPVDCQNAIRNLITVAVDQDWEKFRPRNMVLIVENLKSIVNTQCNADVEKSISLAERKEIEDELNLLKLSLKDEKKYSSSTGERECTDCKSIISTKEGISSCIDHFLCFGCLENEILRQCHNDYRDYFISHGKAIVCPYCLERACPDIMCQTNCMHNIKKFDIGFFAKKIRLEALKLFIKSNAKEDKVVKRKGLLHEHFNPESAVVKMPSNGQIKQIKSIVSKAKTANESETANFPKAVSSLSLSIDFKVYFLHCIDVLEDSLKAAVQNYIPLEEQERTGVSTKVMGGCISILFKSGRMPQQIHSLALVALSQRNYYKHPPGSFSSVSAPYLLNVLPKIIDVIKYYYEEEEEKKEEKS